jgi:hypothetical protein
MARIRNGGDKAGRVLVECVRGHQNTYWDHMLMGSTLGMQALGRVLTKSEGVHELAEAENWWRLLPELKKYHRLLHDLAPL